MKSMLLFLLCLLWSLVEVQSQTEYPYISFRGNILPNHSYVDLSQVGEDKTGNTVQCHTDLETCCRVYQGVHRGTWFAPGSDRRLPFSGEVSNIYENRRPQVVHLQRTNKATIPSGIYRCVIATIKVHDDNDEYFGVAVYVGLYASGGGIHKYTYIYVYTGICNLWKKDIHIFYYIIIFIIASSSDMM